VLAARSAARPMRTLTEASLPDRAASRPVRRHTPWHPLLAPPLAALVGDHTHLDRPLAMAHRAAGFETGIGRALHAPLSTAPVSV